MPTLRSSTSWQFSTVEMSPPFLYFATRARNGRNKSADIADRCRKSVQAIVLVLFVGAGVAASALVRLVLLSGGNYD